MYKEAEPATGGQDATVGVEAAIQDEPAACTGAPLVSSDKVQLETLLQQYDLDEEMNDLAQNGIKKISDLQYLDSETIKDLTLTPVSKSKLRKMTQTFAAQKNADVSNALNSKQECKEEPEAAATAQDVTTAVEQAEPEADAAEEVQTDAADGEQVEPEAAAGQEESAEDNVTDARPRPRADVKGTDAPETTAEAASEPQAELERASATQDSDEGDGVVVKEETIVTKEPATTDAEVQDEPAEEAAEEDRGRCIGAKGVRGDSGWYPHVSELVDETWGYFGGR